MADVHDKKTRSFNMSCIKAKNTKPEMIVRRFLFSKGFRYTLHNNRLPGKPDLALPRYNTVIFVNGCFWHGHDGCKYFVIPKSRTEWWIEKIDKNKKRDYKNSLELSQKGINVITIYECMLKAEKKERTLNLLLKQIVKNLHS